MAAGFRIHPLGRQPEGGGHDGLTLMATMLLGGLWHGAGWNFLVWGFLHGLYLLIERVLPVPLGAFHRWARYVVFQVLAMLAWVPFREPDMGAVWHALGRHSAWLGSQTDLGLKLLVGIVLFSWLENALERRFVKLASWTIRMPLWRFSCVYGLLLFLVLVGASHATTFIYQRF